LLFQNIGYFIAKVPIELFTAISTVEYKEEMFVQNSQERIMGLLGSILSLEEQYDTELSTVMNTTDFLHFIFHVGR